MSKFVKCKWSVLELNKPDKSFIKKNKQVMSLAADSVMDLSHQKNLNSAHSEQHEGRDAPFSPPSRENGRSIQAGSLGWYQL